MAKPANFIKFNILIVGLDFFSVYSNITLKYPKTKRF